MTEPTTSMGGRTLYQQLLVWLTAASIAAMQLGAWGAPWVMTVGALPR